jgi:hypothetical protein
MGLCNCVGSSLLESFKIKLVWKFWCQVCFLFESFWFFCDFWLFFVMFIRCDILGFGVHGVGDYVLFLCIRAIWNFCNSWRWNLCSWKHGWGWWSSPWCEHGPFLQFVKREKNLLAMQQLITIWWGAFQTMEFQALLWKPHSRTFIC